MKTLIVKKENLVEYTDAYPKPSAGPGEVVLKVHRNGICATDMSIFRGTAGFMHDGSTSWPVRFGHEFAGEVTETGKNVKKFHPGDKAISVGYVACGTCEACLKGHYEECPDLRSVGTIHTYPGSYAEYVCFPEEFLIKVPDSFSYDQIALIEPCAVGMDAVRKGHITPGKSSVLIIGTGPIGIAAAALAKHYGAAKVMIAGRTDWKLGIAAQMGCDVCFNTRKQDLHKCVMDATDGHGADTVIECSGSIEALNQSLGVLAHSGTLAVVAFYEQCWTDFDIDAFIMNNCRMESVMYHDFQGVIQAMSEGLDLLPLITRHIPFEECADYFSKSLENVGSKPDIKVMVDFSDD